MTLLLIDMFYIVVTALIFISIAVMELQIKEIKAMIKEHVKFDDKMAKEIKDRLCQERDKKYSKTPL